MRLAFVGDLALGDHPKTVGFGFHSRYADGIPAREASRLPPPGPRPDLLFGNLEFCLGLDPATDLDLASRQCRGLDSYATFLALAGVAVVNVANNHCAQHGSSAFAATVQTCRAAGMTVVGTPADFTEAAAIPVGDRRVVFLGWSDRPRQYARETPPYNELADHAPEIIRAARTHADVVLVSVHWGDEFVQVPAERERQVARSLIDAGATIVVGHHPHVLREVEEYRHGLIAYSLGNFVGDMTWNSDTRVGACLVVELDGDRLLRQHLALSRIESDYLPRYLSGTELTRTAARVERRRRRQAHRIARLGYAAVVAAEHRRQVGATALMMARNVHRYSPGVLLPMLTGALRHRVTRAATGARS